MIQEFQQDSSAFEIIVESGFSSIEGIQTATVSIRKPDLTTIYTKNLTDDDFYPKTTKVRIAITSGNLDQEGIYDYQLVNTTDSKAEKGKLLQFSIRKKLA